MHAAEGKNCGSAENAHCDDDLSEDFDESVVFVDEREEEPVEDRVADIDDVLLNAGFSFVFLFIFIFFFNLIFFRNILMFMLLSLINYYFVLVLLQLVMIIVCVVSIDLGLIS